MEAKELRINNLIIWSGNTHKVESIQSSWITVKKKNLEPMRLPYHKVTPIPLNPKWAIKLGFTKSYFYKWHGDGYDYQPSEHWTERVDFVHENEDCFISFQKEYFNSRLDSESINFYHNQWYERCTEGQIFADISQVHKLQNLFFILFNK